MLTVVGGLGASSQGTQQPVFIIQHLTHHSQINKCFNLSVTAGPNTVCNILLTHCLFCTIYCGMSVSLHNTFKSHSNSSDTFRLDFSKFPFYVAHPILFVL